MGFLVQVNMWIDTNQPMLSGTQLARNKDRAWPLTTTRWLLVITCQITARSNHTLKKVLLENPKENLPQISQKVPGLDLTTGIKVKPKVGMLNSENKRELCLAIMMCRGLVLIMWGRMIWAKGKLAGLSKKGIFLSLGI